MKTILLGALFIFSSPLFSFTFQAYDINLNYKEEQGKLSSSKIKYTDSVVEVDLEKYNFLIEKNQSDLEIKNDNTFLKFKKFEEKLTILEGIKEAQIKNAAATFTKTLLASIENFYVSYGSNKFNVRSIYVECPNIVGDPVKQCLKESNLNVKSIKLPDIFSFALLDELIKSEPEENVEKINLAFRPRIKNIKARIRDNNIAGRATVKLLFNVVFRFWGKVTIDKEKMLIHINHFTVKKGYIPVTRLVLSALRRMDLSQVKIKGNNITIKL